jgi:sugar phosphate isomerase/epimerase
MTQFIGRLEDEMGMPLRFGITALEFMDVAGRVVVDGVPNFSRLNVADIVRNVVSDFSVVELTMDIQHIVPGSLTPNTIKQLGELQEETGASYTVHLPFWSVELTTFNEHVRMGGVNSIIEAIELAKPLDPEAYVLHTTGELISELLKSEYGSNLNRLLSTLLAGFSAASLDDIISKTEINPRKLAIENYKFPFDIMRDVIDDLDTSICFDTAHLLTRMSGSETIMDFYAAHKDRITEIHLQDATYTEYEDAVSFDDHIPLGQGIMGSKVLRDFLSELLKDKFNGPIIFELAKDEAIESLDHIRRIIPEVFD